MEEANFLNRWLAETPASSSPARSYGLRDSVPAKHAHRVVSARSGHRDLLPRPFCGGSLRSLRSRARRKTRQRMRLNNRLFEKGVKRRLTGLTNHRPPPLSNQLRCPPRLVVHKTTYGVCFTSWYGSASFGATYIFTSASALPPPFSTTTFRFFFPQRLKLTGSSSACMAYKGILTPSIGSVEDASR